MKLRESNPFRSIPSMKPTLALRSFLFGSTLLAAAPMLHAAAFFWDGDVVDGGNPAANANGGDGTWNTTLTNWDTLATGGADIAWTNNNQAVFAGTAGTVTLGAAITVSGDTGVSGTTAMYFTTSAYIVAGTNSITTTADSTFRLNGTTFQSGVTIAMGASNPLTLLANGTSSIAGVISGTGSSGLDIGQNGTLSLSGLNTFTGDVLIGNNDGSSLKLQVNSIKSVSGGASALGAPTTAANGLIQIGATSNTSALEFINLAADQTSNRQVRIGSTGNGSGGSRIENNDSDNTVTFSNAAFNNVTSQASSANRTLTLGGSNTGNNTISGTIADIGGSGVLTVSKSGSGTWVLAGASTAASYAGSTNVSAGILKMGIDNALPSGTGKGTVNVNGGATAAGTLDLNGFDQAINGLGGSTGVVLGKIVNDATGTNKTLTVGNNNASGTFNGIIADNTSGTGTIALTKVGTGIQTLTGPNTYSGGTTVSNGPLVFLNTAAKSASGTHAFAAAATLGLGVSGASAFTATDITNAFAGTMTGNLSGITVDPTTTIGIDTTNGDFTFSDPITGSPTRGLTKLGLNTLTLSGSHTYTGSTIVRVGTLALGASDVLPASDVAIGAAILSVGATFTDSTGTLDIAGAASINLGDGASQIAFLDSSAIDWTGGTLNITGIFTPGSSVRFGTTSGGLLPAQLAFISVNGLGAGTYTLDASGYLIVGGYSSWAALNGAGVNRDDDHDFDGVDNGVEFFLGGPSGNTTGFTPLPGVTNTAGVLSVTWTKGSGYTGVYGTDFWVETSPNLDNPWTMETLVGNVTITGNDVKYTFPAGTINFARLKVTGP